MGANAAPCNDESKNRQYRRQSLDDCNRVHLPPHHRVRGYFLLSILRRQSGTEKITAEQNSYFRAGHAHAGVLITLSIIGQLVLDQSRLGDGLVWAIRIALFVAPLLISGGFFGGAPRTAGGPAAPLIRLVPIGAVVFGLATLGVGIGLIIPE